MDDADICLTQHGKTLPEAAVEEKFHNRYPHTHTHTKSTCFNSGSKTCQKQTGSTIQGTRSTFYHHVTWSKYLETHLTCAYTLTPNRSHEKCTLCTHSIKRNEAPSIVLYSRDTLFSCSAITANSASFFSSLLF